MINVGEQLVSSYLRHKRGCDFIETNIKTQDQGEIDVIGLNTKKQRAYICEVSISLTSGIQRTTKNSIETVKVHTDKFSRAIEYARDHLCYYEHHFMLWSPIVKNNRRTPANSQIQHLEKIKTNIKELYDVDIECIVNKRFLECLRELRDWTKSKTPELQCPLMRLMQLEEHFNKHLAKLGQ